MLLVEPQGVINTGDVGGEKTVNLDTGLPPTPDCPVPPCIHLPSQAPGTASISATDILNSLASYSNHGLSGALLAAPGGDAPNPALPLDRCVIPNAFQSLIVGLCSSSRIQLIGPNPPIFPCAGGNFYVSAAGTSFAAAAAAGVAALLEANRDLSPEQLRKILAKTADDLGAPGEDPLFGAGLLNASNAVAALSDDDDDDF